MRRDNRGKVRRGRRTERWNSLWLERKMNVLPWSGLIHLIRNSKSAVYIVAGLLAAITVATICSGNSPREKQVSACNKVVSKVTQSALIETPARPGSTKVSLPQAQVPCSAVDVQSEPSSGCSSNGGAQFKPSSPASQPSLPPQTPPVADPSSRIDKMVFARNKDESAVPAGESSFSAVSVYSIYICITWKNLWGSHDEVIKVYCPDGQLYQQIHIPLTTHPLPSMTKRTAWSPRPVAVKLIPQINGVYPVWAELPIAGSWAMRLTGTWKVKVYLDEDPSCNGESSFVLGP